MTTPPEGEVPTLEAYTRRLLTYAQIYCDWGISFVPAIYQSKRPAIPWKPFQERAPTLEEAQGWFAGKVFNIAVVTGLVSKLAVLDFDDVANYHTAFGTSRVAIEDQTLVVRTFRGYHVYLRISEHVPSMTYLDCFEVKGEGSLVIAPPSIHPTGKAYEPLNKALQIKEVEDIEGFIKGLLDNLGNGPKKGFMTTEVFPHD